MTWTPDFCIYHFPCHDGYMSGLIAKKKWPDVHLVPINYGEEIVPKALFRDRNLLIADFSFKPDVMRSFGAKSIVVLDHHKTAAKDLEEFGQVNYNADQMSEYLSVILAHFDMNHSGAVLTWKFCFPELTMPRLVRFIEDRDLWKFALAETRRVHLLLESYGYDPGTWNSLLDKFDDPAQASTLISYGEAIEQFYNRQVEEMAQTAKVEWLAGYKVPIVHVPYNFVSDVASTLLEQHPEAPFAACIVRAHGGTTYSLRSRDDRVDVSEVARKYGGGGHRNAAGFRMP